VARKVCIEEGCEDQSISRGRCPKHYQALRRREKDPLVGTRRRGRTPQDACSIEGCEGKGYARGMCVTHYRKALRRVKRRSFAEQVLALWDKHDLDADVLGWGVDPRTEEISFEVWTDKGIVKLTKYNFSSLAKLLKVSPESAYEEWASVAA